VHFLLVARIITFELQLRRIKPFEPLAFVAPILALSLEQAASKPWESTYL
jgi:hypothetical protein